MLLSQLKALLLELHIFQAFSCENCTSSETALLEVLRQQIQEVEVDLNNRGYRYVKKKLELLLEVSTVSKTVGHS